MERGGATSNEWVSCIYQRLTPSSHGLQPCQWELSSPTEGSRKDTGPRETELLFPVPEDTLFPFCTEVFQPRSPIIPLRGYSWFPNTRNHPCVRDQSWHGASPHLAHQITKGLGSLVREEKAKVMCAYKKPKPKSKPQCAPHTAFCETPSPYYRGAESTEVGWKGHEDHTGSGPSSAT